MAELRRVRVGCVDERERRFLELLAYAKGEEDVIGLYVFGSRGREDGFSDDRSDYDVGVVLRDRHGVREAFDARWPYVHGASVEIAAGTLAELREAGEYGTPSEWCRYQYARVQLLVDKTGEVNAVLHEKAAVPGEVRDRVIRDALGGYINATYRSLRYGMVGDPVGARLDGVESVPYLLTALFAIDGRVRPFNKYLASELRDQPLSDPAWRVDWLLPSVMGVLDGNAEDQRALFREVERVAREQGFTDVIDGWEPDVAWLRGEAEYRPA